MRKRSFITQETKDRVKDLLVEGKRFKEISLLTNLSVKQISALKIYYKFTSPNNIGYIKECNHDYFNIIDSEIKAYILGFIIADGSIIVEPKKRNNTIYSYSKRITFCNSVDDREILEQIKKEISPEAIIKEVRNEKGALNRKLQLHLRISSRNLVDILIEKYRIIPNKTYDSSFKFPFETIPYNLVRHFIRGFFDGDGWLIGNKFSKNNKIAFISSSLNFLEQISLILEKELSIGARFAKVKGKTLDYYTMNTKYSALHKRDSLKVIQHKAMELYNYLYKESTIFLERKRCKFLVNGEVIPR